MNSCHLFNFFPDQLVYLHCLHGLSCTLSFFTSSLHDSLNQRLSGPTIHGTRNSWDLRITYPTFTWTYDSRDQKFMGSKNHIPDVYLDLRFTGPEIHGTSESHTRRLSGPTNHGTREKWVQRFTEPRIHGTKNHWAKIHGAYDTQDQKFT